MNDTVEYDDARVIMGNHFIGVEELEKIESKKLLIREKSREIPFSKEELELKKDKYLLILGVSTFIDGTPVTIRNLIELFGKEPEKSEPCFYNQDWYNNEAFIDIPMKDGWFLIRIDVYEESRGVQPSQLMNNYCFPTAVCCTFAFFVAWLALDIKLWLYDFVWCKDTDHNGDRIYVGKYHDVDGINKNGYSIHRHLALRPCYACID